ncbi:WhiB family transcriptional regulator [Streptomyces vietnamensis]|uniref:WhiB family transcriptional regulator n=1 Tax=Streptomyces vietnamensis TaxID=362257 RepID=UPI0037904530
MNTSTAPVFTTTGAEPCVGLDVFFPDDYHDNREVNRAKALCWTCPVLQECRAWALDNPGLATHGIWGGLTPKQRSTYRRPAPAHT